jgi:hypothetical protein
VRPVVVIGVGELGAIFARGLLRLGRPVYPVTRSLPAATVASTLPDPERVLVSVGESDLGAVLDTLPNPWRSRVVLVQNELLPRDWQAHGIEQPSVAVVWFEKKPTTLQKELLPSVLFGEGAPLLADALAAVGLHTRIVSSEAELVAELVQKNLYILLTNIAGLEVGGSVAELLGEHRELAERVARDVIELQSRLARTELSRQDLWAGFERAVAADPAHACTGRSAPDRLVRALRNADALGVEVPELRRIGELVRRRS